LLSLISGVEISADGGANVAEQLQSTAGVTVVVPVIAGKEAQPFWSWRAVAIALLLLGTGPDAIVVALENSPTKVGAQFLPSSTTG